ncbi:hypothetical protein V5P93_006101 [Actinokineospora auranticolor]|uniref:YbaB/EbfC DNA-binding family protein n=1 Tax=Actinokineospora auranticolor TaxID=155976 RepID=A0A2S6GG65_9PSEU|nr:hypothetical protein [Actinokineospora auranticolor]PPK64190.1 hypothetical protein CLV40_12154 [Actinokineospora auranticolor]
MTLTERLSSITATATGNHGIKTTVTVDGLLIALDLGTTTYTMSASALAAEITTLTHRAAADALAQGMAILEPHTGTEFPTNEPPEPDYTPPTWSLSP